MLKFWYSVEIDEKTNIVQRQKILFNLSQSIYFCKKMAEWNEK